MTDIQDLIKRLRKEDEETIFATAEEAADALERLEAEIERLHKTIKDLRQELKDAGDMSWEEASG